MILIFFFYIYHRYKIPTNISYNIFQAKYFCWCILCSRYTPEASYLKLCLTLRRVMKIVSSGFSFKSSLFIYKSIVLKKIT